MTKSQSSWWVYVVKCKDDSYYTGISNDVEKRVAAHNAGKGAKYTMHRRPVELIFNEKCENKSEASIREAQLKKLTHAQKVKLKL